VLSLVWFGRDFPSPSLALKSKCLSADQPGLIGCVAAIDSATIKNEGGTLVSAHLVSYIERGRGTVQVWVVSYHNVRSYFSPFGGCTLLDEYVSVNARTGDLQSVAGEGSKRCP